MPTDIADIPVPPECRQMIQAGALAVNTSGGKGSQAMTILLSRIVPCGQLVAVHAPLGKVQWPDTIWHIEATLPDGVPLILAPVASGLGIDPGWNAQRVDVMRWVLRCKREANAGKIDAVLAETADRPIVEVSARDPWWGARPVADRYEGRNVLGRLWMELRQQLLEGNPESRSGAWLGRIRIGRLAGGPVVPRAARAAV